MQATERSSFGWRKQFPYHTFLPNRRYLPYPLQDVYHQADCQECQENDPRKRGHGYNNEQNTNMILTQIRKKRIEFGIFESFGYLGVILTGIMFIPIFTELFQHPTQTSPFIPLITLWGIASSTVWLIHAVGNRLIPRIVVCVILIILLSFVNVIAHRNLTHF